MAHNIKNEGKLANSSSAPMIQKQKKNTKRKSIAISKLEANLFNRISKGKSVVEPTNDNTNQMDIDQATDHFEEEILVDILSRLSVRSLLRFKCVSEFWKTLISEPYFKMKHLNIAKNDQDSQKFLIRPRYPKNRIFSLYCCPLSSVQLAEDVQRLDCPSNPQPLRCTIRCCYDGLAVIEIPDNLDAKHSTFLLWNPSIKESIVLPALELPLDAESRFGLGYDSTSGDYKILHIHEDLGDCKLPNEILVLKGGSWRRIDKHPRGINSLVFECLAFVHAAFHWIGISRSYFVVVSFSISNEVYGEIPLPDEMLSLRGNILNEDTSIGISVLEGLICLHSNSYRQGKDTFKLWVLKEYGVKESWVPLLTIIEDPLIYNVVPKYRFEDGEVLFGCWILQDSRTAFRTLSGPFVSWPLCVIEENGLAFTESLISPKSLT